MAGEQMNSDLETSSASCTSTFLLRRLSKQPSSPSVEVNFSPLPSSTSTGHTVPLNSTRYSHPTFNKDTSYFTPAFILDIDREKYILNASSYLGLHQAKKQELQDQKTDLFVPKPSKGSSFCCICRIAFDDYLTHVNIPKHQATLRKCEFSSSIEQLCHMFNINTVEQTIKSGPKKQNKRIQKQEKRGKRSKKQIDVTCNSNSIKMQFSAQGKTKETLV